MFYNMLVVLLLFYLLYLDLYFGVLRLQKYGFSFSVHFELARNLYILFCCFFLFQLLQIIMNLLAILYFFQWVLSMCSSFIVRVLFVL
jgi:hypothetical protein